MIGIDTAKDDGLPAVFMVELSIRERHRYCRWRMPHFFFIGGPQAASDDCLNRLLP